MKRLIVLDSTPTGLGCHNPSSPATQAFLVWLTDKLAQGAFVYLPEIADYEVRRKLMHIGSSNGIARLDRMALTLKYAPITTAVMRKAAELWADSRRRGRPTSGSRALDADSILAAQALLLGGPGDSVTVATENVGHLGQFVDAQPWATI